MTTSNLELSQYVQKHPIINQNRRFKIQYIYILNYFHLKYSKNSQWAHSMIQLYKSVFLDNTDAQKMCDIVFDDFELEKAVKRYGFIKYRYCIFIDCLFINAYNSKPKARKIADELSSAYDGKYTKEIDMLYNELYGGEVCVKKLPNTDYMRECWMKNRAFLKLPKKRILITATMSAGKSTLLNALTGKHVTRMMNEACTSKIHYIINKSYEDGFSYEHDYVLRLNAGMEELMDDDLRNKSSEISVGARFFSSREVNGRVCFIDTPGVNSGEYPEHRTISRNMLSSGEYDLVLVLLNGGNLGTDDERENLEYICKNCDKDIIFVINKLDKFRSGEDSVDDSIERAKKSLMEIGFVNPRVYPASAYAGYLAKISLKGEPMDKYTADEFEILSLKLDIPDYRFGRYYPAETQIQADGGDAEKLLINSGIASLEQLLYNLQGRNTKL